MSRIMYLRALEHVFSSRDMMANQDGHAILEIVGNCRLTDSNGMLRCVEWLINPNILKTLGSFKISASIY